MNSDSKFKSIYVVVFTLLSIRLKEFIKLPDLSLIVQSALLGAVGGIVGFIVYSCIKKSNSTIKLSILVLCLLIYIGLIFLIINGRTKDRSDGNFLNQSQSLSHNSILKIDSALLNEVVNSKAIEFDDLSMEQRKKLKTCEVCGYVAHLADSSFCLYCYSDDIDTILFKEIGKKEWLRNSQLYFFSVSDSSEIEFYKPDIDNGFQKDRSWRPVVTKSEVEEYSKE